MLLQQQLGPLMFSSLGVLLPAMRSELHFGVIQLGWLGSARTVGNLLVFPASILLVRFKPIRMFNHGNMQRDFTYIDDVAQGTLKVLDHLPSGTPPWALFNIGNHQPVALPDYIAALEAALGRKALIEPAPMQPGDVPATYADIERLAQATGFSPSTPLQAGLAEFAAWFKRYYGHA